MASPNSIPRLVLRKDDYPTTGLGSKEALDTLFRPLNGHLEAVSSSLSSSLTVGQNLQFKTITFRTPSTDWTAATLAAGWTNFGAPNPAAAQYRKDQNGTVFVEAAVVHATAGVAFNLPAGYRPDAQLEFATVVNDGASKISLILVKANGDVALSGVNPSVWGDIFCSFTSNDRTPVPLSPTFPLTVSTSIQKPTAAWLVNISDQTTPTAVCAAQGMQWANAGGGQIKILNIPGLTLGRTYQATIAVAAG